ncbi:MAG: aminotransferase class I/II-fold pyridoxal phosphate-dependent enzyme [Noviherbaspirillum sp.]
MAHADGAGICEQIVRKVGMEHGLEIHSIALLPSKKLPKTTSGKLQRSRCRELYEKGLLDPVFVYAAADGNSGPASPAAPGGDREIPEDGIEEWIVAWVRSKSRTAPTTISGNAQFAQSGIDSLGIMDLVVALEERLNIALDPALAIDYPSPRELARYIAYTFSISRIPPWRNENAVPMRLARPAVTDEDLKNQVVGNLMRKLGAARILGLHSDPAAGRPNYFIFREISAKPMLGFQSCSYLNLEWHQVLQQKAIEAILRHGTQFSCSRAFVSVGAYAELGSMLADIFGMDPVICSSTTLAHLAALPALIRSGDIIIIIDEEAHNSMQMAVKICMANGTPIYKCRHPDMAMLEKMIVENHPGGTGRIWYLADGLYSMRGDFIDMKALFALMQEFSALHAYIDDAHAFGWLNQNGRGHVASFHAHPQFD